MQRVLAKIIDIKKVTEKKTGSFKVVTLKCKVKITESGAKGFKLPKRMKGKVGWLVRECVHPWRFKKGDEIILDPEETRKFILITDKNPPLLQPGKVLSYERDINIDGYKERIIENDFVTAVINPHLGARIGELHYKALDENLFKQLLTYGQKEYVEYGGSDEYISQDYPGKLWNAEFKETVKGRRPVSPSQSRYVVYSHKTGGIEIKKRVEILPALPIVYQMITLTYHKKGKKEITYWHRIPIAIREPEWQNIIYIPTREKLEKIRYSEPFRTWWWPQWDKYFALKLGAALYVNEQTKKSFLWLSAPKDFDIMKVRKSKPLFMLAPQWRPVELKRKQKVKYEFLYALGNGYIVSQDIIGIMSKKSDKKGMISVVIKTCKEIKSPMKITIRDTEKLLPLLKTKIAGIDNLYTGTLSLQFKTDEKISARIVVDSKEYKFIT